MAIPDFSDEYATHIGDTRQFYGELDLENPTNNKIEKEKSTNPLQIARFQSELSAHIIGDISQWISDKCTLRDNIPNPAGGTFSAEELQTELRTLASKNYVGSRQIQQRASEGIKLALGEEEQIQLLISLPNFGQQDSVDATSLKQIDEFLGDGENNIESENLKKFLRSIYSICRAKTNEEACRSAILRKIGGTAQKLIDRLSLQYTDTTTNEIEVGKPSLAEIAHILERRYFASSTPEIAHAKLSQLLRFDSESLNALEGRISTLTAQAALAETKDNQKTFISTKETKVFKAAISTLDRNLVNQENASRNNNGLPSMDMSDMVNFLLKYHAEKQAYSTVKSQLPKGKPFHNEKSDTDSLNKASENIKQTFERGKFPLRRGNQRFQQRNGRPGFRPNFNSRPNFSNGPTFNTNRNPNFTARGQNMTRNQRFRGRNGRFFGGRNRGNNNSTNFSPNSSKPRVFVTPEMVGVAPHQCLKCASTDHRFTETHRCIYGQSQLFSKSCENCKKGGHHFSVCMNSQKPTVGAQFPQPYPQNPRKTGLVEKQPFSNWTPPEDMNTFSENPQIPSLDWNAL